MLGYKADRRQCASQGFFNLHQGHRGQAWTNFLGGKNAIWRDPARTQGLWRLGAQCVLLPQWRPAGLGGPQQHHHCGWCSHGQRVSAAATHPNTIFIACITITSWFYETQFYVWLCMNFTLPSRVTQLTTTHLPLLSVLFVSPTEIVAAVSRTFCVYLCMCVCRLI